jgi:hypothetical protein
MLYISVKRIDTAISSSQTATVFATIIDYSKKGIKTESSILHWRLREENDWKSIQLHTTNDPSHFFADIPSTYKNSEVEYYVSTSSESGRNETMPRTAPDGYFSFKVK